MSKPKILLASDSAFLDTGFGRVAREIGMGLVESGRFEVAQHGWFHGPNDKLVPFQVFPTYQHTAEFREADKYGKISFEHVVAEYQPDAVLAIGDHWMIKHLAAAPRNFPIVAYVPIDSAPVKPEWAMTMAGFDKVVLYGEFGAECVKRVTSMPFVTIPHGVDTSVFRPLPADQKAKLRHGMTGGGRFKFVVGCVGRNNARKQLPRLLKAFRKFINPSTACQKCGKVVYAKVTSCPQCGEPDNLHAFEGKRDAVLYMHCAPKDPAGHDLKDLVRRFGLSGFVGFPDGMEIGRGCGDVQLNQIYNAMDVFTLPTGGEGWGLPILEAMAAGLPVLVTGYSGHVEFVDGAGDFIEIADWDTNPDTNGERALVDLDDYAMRLDRFYLEREGWVAKYGPLLRKAGMNQQQVEGMSCGRELREGLGKVAAERAVSYEWRDVRAKWVDLFDGLIGRPLRNAPMELAVEEV